PSRSSTRPIRGVPCGCARLRPRAGAWSNLSRSWFHFGSRFILVQGDSRIVFKGTSPAADCGWTAGRARCCGNELTVMPSFNRRAFLAGSAASAAAPALRALAATGDLDAVVVGAGAAGIAAGRRLAAAGRRFAVIEAAERVGGRCITDT